MDLHTLSLIKQELKWKPSKKKFNHKPYLTNEQATESAKMLNKQWLTHCQHYATKLVEFSRAELPDPAKQ